MGAFSPHGGALSRGLVGMFSPAERSAYDRIAEVSALEAAYVAHEFDQPDSTRIPAPIEFRMGDVQAGRMPFIASQRYGTLQR